MDQMKTYVQCDRGDDLVSFLYGEVNDREAADFQTHFQECSTCQHELVEFGDVHQSMVSWRDEMLVGFVATPVAAPVRQKSALAALREFFELSPLWMKGAVGFAALLLVTLGVIGASQLNSRPVQPPIVRIQSDAKYTEEQLQERIAEAQRNWVAIQTPEPKTIVESKPAPKAPQNVVVNTAPPKKGRSPLSKSEREQLAAALRLRSTDDDDLTLLGDRINKEF